MNEKRQSLVRIEYKQLDGNIHSDIIKCSNLLNRRLMLDYLADNAFILPQLENGNKLLMQYLTTYQNAPKAIFVSRKNSQMPVYIRPDVIIGRTNLDCDIFFAQDPNVAPTVYSQSGTLKERKQNTKTCYNHYRRSVPYDGYCSEQSK